MNTPTCLPSIYRHFSVLFSVFCEKRVLWTTANLKANQPSLNRTQTAVPPFALICGKSPGALSRDGISIVHTNCTICSKPHQKLDLECYQTPAAETRILESPVSGKMLISGGICSGFKKVSWNNQELHNHPPSGPRQTVAGSERCVYRSWRLWYLLRCGRDHAESP